MPLVLRTLSAGTVTLNVADTASDLTINAQASNGVLSYADSSTGGMYLPVGTTAQRPSAPATGMMRFNATTNSVEVYNGSSWS